VDYIVGIGQSIAGTEVNRLRYLACRSLDASDVALQVEWARHLDTDVDIHCFMSMRWVMIKE
jgi:hypothetical protein